MDLEKFLNKIQSADESSKRRWLIVSTVLAMVIVIFVWLKYFNTLIAPQYENAKEPETGFSLGQSIESGGALIYNGFFGIVDQVKQNVNELRKK